MSGPPPHPPPNLSVFQPVGQKRLTNIAVVRYKKGGKRFEVACYPNKVSDWRNGVEKDLDEVLQTESVFLNVSKGIHAPKDELERVFGTSNTRAICLLLLEKGELQVSDKERKGDFDARFKDVVSILVEKCINPQTGRPYTYSLLERALHEIHFAPDITKPAKVQAFQALEKLREVMSIARAQMRLRVRVPEATEADCRELLTSLHATLESADLDESSFVTQLLLEPGHYRALDAGIQSMSRGKGRVEVMAVAVQDGVGGGEPTTSQSSNPSSFAVAPETAMTPVRTEARVSRPVFDPRGRDGGVDLGGDVIHPRCSVGSLPESLGSRRERFLELDDLQPGWEVEVRVKAGSDLGDAVFFSPEGVFCRSFAEARRKALAWAKKH